MKTRPDIAALALCGVVIVACTVLAVLGKQIPDFLPLLGMTLAGVGGGTALNGAAKQPAAAAAGAPVTSSVPLAPAPLDVDPPTGYFARIAAGGKP